MQHPALAGAAPAGGALPGLRRGGEEYLHPGPGQHHHCPDVPAVHDHVPLLACRRWKSSRKSRTAGRAPTWEARAETAFSPDGLSHNSVRTGTSAVRRPPVVHPDVRPSSRDSHLRAGLEGSAPPPGPAGPLCGRWPPYPQIPQLLGPAPGPGVLFPAPAGPSMAILLLPHLTIRSVVLFVPPFFLREKEQRTRSPGAIRPGALGRRLLSPCLRGTGSMKRRKGLHGSAKRQPPSPPPGRWPRRSGG